MEKDQSTSQEDIKKIRVIRSNKSKNEKIILSMIDRQI